MISDISELLARNISTARDGKILPTAVVDTAYMTDWWVSLPAPNDHLITIQINNILSFAAAGVSRKGEDIIAQVAFVPTGSGKWNYYLMCDGVSVPTNPLPTPGDLAKVVNL